MTRYVAETVEELPAASQASAGVDQALDLLTRSESDTPSSIGERDYLRRAVVQLVGTQEIALGAGLDDVATAAATAMKSLDAAIAALDAGEPHEAYVQDARDVLTSL
jgi:hypothetical protein